MALYSVKLDVDGALAPPRSCHACGAGQLVTIAENGEVLFVCRSCRRSWSFQLGRMVPLPRGKCTSCNRGLACVTHPVPRRRGAS